MTPDAPSTAWQNPPEAIANCLDAPLLPRTFLSPDGQWLCQLEHPPLPPLAALAQPRVQVAGIQFNPATRSPALEYAFRQLTLRHLETGKEQRIALPEDARLRNFCWSPQGRYLAFTHTCPSGLELWVVDVPQGQARQLTPPILNGVYGSPCTWISEQAGLLCQVVPPDWPAPPEPPRILGPRIEENLGQEAPARTYTHLLQNPYDEAQLEYYLASVLVRVDLDGHRTVLSEPLLIDEAMPSPDGQWILLETVEHPFSYQVPLSAFPRRTVVLDASGKLVREVASLPLADQVPINFTSVRPGRRILWWRADCPATLYWVEALDGGDSRQEAEYRDAVYQLPAPFTGTGELLWRTQLRYHRLRWGDATRALATEYWYDTRQMRTWLLNPQQPGQPVLLEDRDAQDAYSNPGSPMLMANEHGWYCLRFAEDGQSLYLSGRGASPAGVYPFLDRWNLSTQTKVRLWQAQDPYFEEVEDLLDDGARQFITRQQSATQPANYRRRDRETEASVALTQFEDPLPWFAGVQREVVRYARADGLSLSARVYLPPDYAPQRDGPLPLLLWVYPQEYKSRDSASQVTAAKHAFTRPWGTSPLFLLTQGYGVVMGPTLPILGEGERAPNDTYLEQLRLGAAAAVDYLVQRGLGERGRFAIAGQSYGAFTTANLLAHTDLFQAGIALSGAYNRTLTPFGFQGEQRPFWQATDTYMEMSPFTYAHKITRPLLLIHGAEDENAGTYPLQSERLYGALRGLGGTVRWVELPFEGHGYRSREAIGHTLWEVTHWLDTYVKPGG